MTLHVGPVEVEQPPEVPQQRVGLGERVVGEGERRVALDRLLEAPLGSSEVLRRLRDQTVTPLPLQRVGLEIFGWLPA